MTPEEVNKKYGYGQADHKNINYPFNNTKKYTRYETNQNGNSNHTTNSDGGFNMSVTKQKNIVGVFVFLILQVMFLFSHFTIAGTVNTLFVLLYLIFRNIINNKTEEEYLSVRFGNYIGVSFLNILLITLFQFVNIKSIEVLVESDYFGFVIGAVICPIVFLIIYGIASAMITKKGPIISILKYLIPYGVYFAFLNSFYPIEKVGNVCLFALAIFYLMFWIVDLYIQKTTGKPDKSIIISAIFSSSIIIIMSAFSIDYAGGIIYGFTHLNSLTSWKWYTVVIIAVIFIVASCVCFAIDYNKNADENRYYLSDDTINLFLILFDIICFAIGIKFYTKYIAVFAIMLFMVNFITLIIPFKKYKNDSVLERVFNNKFFAELIMMGVLITLFFGFTNGIIDIVAIIILSLIAIFAFIECGYSWKYNLFIILAAVLSCAFVYHWHHSPSNYLYVGAVTVLFSVVIFIVGIHNKKIEQSDDDPIILPKIAILIMGIIIMMTPMSHTGVHIYDKVEIPTSIVSESEKNAEDEATITIYFKPHGKDNNVEACSYYWTSNEDEIFIQVLEENNFSIKKKGADTLVVVCYDSNGVKTTYKHSYNIKV